MKLLKNIPESLLWIPLLGYWPLRRLKYSNRIARGRFFYRITDDYFIWHLAWGIAFLLVYMTILVTLSVVKR